ncbi:hypothetical protein M885DRAFT_564648 [Pelagophyceae sp. CCMP2097]|nr:hypothetical protein M885DRAFT_564648 [Pelagophyceae sp. CCMP2097]
MGGPYGGHSGYGSLQEARCHGESDDPFTAAPPLKGSRSFKQRLVGVGVVVGVIVAVTALSWAYFPESLRDGFPQFDDADVSGVSDVDVLAAANPRVWLAAAAPTVGREGTPAEMLTDPAPKVVNSTGDDDAGSAADHDWSTTVGFLAFLFAMLFLTLLVVTISFVGGTKCLGCKAGACSQGCADCANGCFALTGRTQAPTTRAPPSACLEDARLATDGSTTMCSYNNYFDDRMKRMLDRPLARATEIKLTAGDVSALGGGDERARIERLRRQVRDEDAEHQRLCDRLAQLRADGEAAGGPESPPGPGGAPGGHDD